MKKWSRSLIQFFVCMIIACISIVLEHSRSTPFIQQFLLSNIIGVIFVIIALNVTSIVFFLSRLIDMENQHARPFYFDKTKLSALQGIRELFILIIVAYISIIFIPVDFKIESLRDIFSSSGLLASLMIRACLFMSIYITYDFAKTVITSTINPVSSK